MPPATRAWLVVCAGAIACGDSTSPDNTPLATTSVAVEADSGSSTRTLSVSLSAPRGIEVRYWADAASRLRVVSAEPATEHSVFLPALRAGELYDYEIRPIDRGLSLPPLFRGRFISDTLPSDLADIRFTSLGRPTSRLTMLELRGAVFEGYVIVDQDGAIVWFRRGVAESFTRRVNGDFVLLDQGGLTEVRPDLRVVARLPATSEMTMHHDVIATPDNTVLFLAHDTATFSETVWESDAIWEWDPDGGPLTERWRASDFLSPDRDLGPKSSTGDWLHANSLALGPRGNVLVSLPALNQIVSIAPGFQSLEWRLGGPNATITPEGPAEFWFEHTAAEIATNRVLLFDNGRDRPAGLFSRGLELQLDPARGTASVAWDFRPGPDIYAPIIGSARRLPNGNTLVDFGTSPGVVGATGPVAVYEVTADGQVLWVLRVSAAGLLNYRATPLHDIAGETIVEERPLH